MTMEASDSSRAPGAILQLLKVGEEETRPLVLLWIHSLFVGLAIVPLYAAANALFLAHLPADALPYAYMVSALLGVLSGVLYRHARRRLTVSRAFTGLLLTLLLCLLLLRLGLSLTASVWPAFLLLGFQSVSKALLSVELWSVAGQVFNVRQSKRLFGLIGSGELLATVAGGLATPMIVALIGTENLLLVAAGGVAGAIVVLQAIVRRHASQLRRPEESAEEEQQNEGGVIPLGRQPYIRSLFTLTFVGVASHRLIDFAFLNQARDRIQGQDDLAQLFGILFGVAQALTFLMLTFLTGPVISRYGITRAMRPRRQVLTLCVVLTLLVLATTTHADALFFLAVAAKIADLVLLGALTTPAFLVLYQPLRPSHRLTTQVAVDGVVGPVASGAAAGILVLLAATVGGGPLTLALLTLSLLIGWRFVAVWVDRGYRQALPEALQHRRLEGTSLSLDDGEMEQVLRARLGSRRPHEVLYAFDLLTTRFGASTSQLALPLISHHHPEVRREAARRVESVDDPYLEHAIRTQLEVEAEPRVQAALLLALAACAEADAVDGLSPYIDDEQPDVAAAAMIGLLRTGGVDGILVAGERLLSMERSDRSQDRRMAAFVLGEVGNRGFYRHLRPLLADADAQVRAAALTAAGKVRSVRLWPEILANLNEIAFHRAAAGALVEAGPDTLPLLIATLGDPQQPIQVRSRIAAICGQLGGDEAIEALQLRMDSEDRRLRTAILDALDRVDYRAPDSQRANIDDIVWQELADAAWLLASQDDLVSGAACAPLLRALQHRVSGIRHRCLLLSCFVHGANVKRAAERLTTNVSQRAYALEVFETTLSGDARRHLLRLFEHEPAALRASLAIDFAQQRMTCDQRLALLIVPGGHRLEPWIRASALYAAAEMQMTQLVDIILEALEEDDPLIRQTAAWALSRLETELWQTHIEERGVTLPDEWLAQLIRHTQSDKESRMFLTVEKVMILRSISVFSDVPEEVLADLAGYLEELDVAAQEPVYEKGAVGRTMYIVAEGKVRVHDETRTFVELGAGEFFGELTTLDPEPHSASVTAVEDTQMLVLDRDALYELMATHSTVLRGLIHTLCRRLRDKGRRG